MRILLDECVPRGLKREFRPHDALTVAEAGWAGLKNGALLARIPGQFEVFVTVDRSIQFQQNLSAYPVVFVFIEARSNDITVLRPLVPRVLDAIETAEQGTVVVIAG